MTKTFWESPAGITLIVLACICALPLLGGLLIELGHLVSWLFTTIDTAETWAWTDGVTGFVAWFIRATTVGVATVSVVVVFALMSISMREL